MRTVALKELQRRLLECVRLASQGERVLIREAGRVVAELVPPASARPERISDPVLAELVREGLATPALDPGQPLRAKPHRRWKLFEVLADLDRDRGP